MNAKEIKEAKMLVRSIYPSQEMFTRSFAHGTELVLKDGDYRTRLTTFEDAEEYARIHSQEIVYT